MHQNKSKTSFLFEKNPLWLALAIQLVVFATISLCLPIIAHWIIPPYTFFWLVLAQSALTSTISFTLKMPRWWLWIQAILPFGLWLGLSQSVIPFYWFGIIALLLMLIFSNALSDRVPLYLSNRITHRALAQLVAEYNIKTAVDLGSGLGGVVRALAKQGVTTTGIEFSPILSMISNRICNWLSLGHIIRGDMWAQDLSSYDLVYVFLSPVPMPAIWQKARSEMKVGCVLVSNSFEIPNIEPDDIWELADKRRTQLFIYVIK
jgi:hypothetical protein